LHLHLRYQYVEVKCHCNAFLCCTCAFTDYPPHFSGLTYEVCNQMLEILLIIDMIINVSRAFYNNQGVLVYDLRAIRVRYISDSFFLDLVAAIPFKVLVQLNGSVNEGYASWLRLPKMLRIYRLFRLYQKFQKSVAQASVTVGVLRLIPLILSLTHVYACIWWYIGTVGQPHTLEDLVALGSLNSLPKTWVFFYSGLGELHMWTDSVSIVKQYIFSFYWMASTLSTSSLVGNTTPKNATEVLFTIWSMLTTLTVYAYVMGEITNTIMSNDETLVEMREEVSRVQTFINRSRFSRDVAVDVVATFYDHFHANLDAQQVNSMLSNSLRVEVAMHMSLPLLKSNKLFSACSSGFKASLAVVLREMAMSGDDIVFSTNDVCNDLYIVASGVVNILATSQDNHETVRCYLHASPIFALRNVN
jgi:potassium channel